MLDDPATLCVACRGRREAQAGMRGVKGGGVPRPAIERVLARVIIAETGCWEFQGARQQRGHGLVRVGSRTDGTSRLEKAHRVVYAACVGPIPPGLALDHLCGNPPCVNPDHLDPCTRGENIRREADRRTTCQKGHPWEPENIRVFRDGRRTCRVCLNAARRAARLRRSRA